MPDDGEAYPVGSRVVIAERADLERFRMEWKLHDQLEQRQLRYAGVGASVRAVGFYHGGDALYSLRGVPGVWHERCLQAATEARPGARLRKDLRWHYVAASIPAAVAVGAFIVAWWRLDACLDRGGSFDYAVSACDLGATHAASSLMGQHALWLTVGGLVTLVAIGALRRR